MVAVTALSLILASVPTGNTGDDGIGQDHPNIVLVMTDDQGYGDLGVTGNSVIETPNLDRLAEAGAVSEGFAMRPGCYPTRASKGRPRTVAAAVNVPTFSRSSAPPMPDGAGFVLEPSLDLAEEIPLGVDCGYSRDHHVQAHPGSRRFHRQVP